MSNDLGHVTWGDRRFRLLSVAGSPTTNRMTFVVEECDIGEAMKQEGERLLETAGKEDANNV